MHANLTESIGIDDFSSIANLKPKFFSMNLALNANEITLYFIPLSKPN